MKFDKGGDKKWKISDRHQLPKSAELLREDEKRFEINIIMQMKGERNASSSGRRWGGGGEEE